MPYGRCFFNELFNTNSNQLVDTSSLSDKNQKQHAVQFFL